MPTPEDKTIEVNKGEHGGRPFVTGSELTLCELFRGLADGRTVTSLADQYRIPREALAAIVRTVAESYDVDLYARLSTPVWYNDFFDRVDLRRAEEPATDCPSGPGG